MLSLFSGLYNFLQCIADKIKCLWNKVKNIWNAAGKFVQSSLEKVKTPSFWLQKIISVSLYFLWPLFALSLTVFFVLLIGLIVISFLPVGNLVVTSTLGIITLITFGISAVVALVTGVTIIICLVSRRIINWWQQKDLDLKKENLALQKKVEKVDIKVESDKSIKSDPPKPKSPIEEAKSTNSLPNKKEELSDLVLISSLVMELKMILDSIPNSNNLSSAQKTFITKSDRVLDILQKSFQNFINQKSDFDSFRKIVQIFHRHVALFLPLGCEKQQDQKSIAVCKAYVAALVMQFELCCQKKQKTYEKFYDDFAKNYEKIAAEAFLASERLKSLKQQDFLHDLMKQAKLDRDYKFIETIVVRNEALLGEVKKNIDFRDDDLNKKKAEVEKNFKRLLSYLKLTNELELYAHIADKKGMAAVDLSLEYIDFLNRACENPDTFFALQKVKLKEVTQNLLQIKAIMPNPCMAFMKVITMVLQAMPKHEISLQKGRQNYDKFREIIDTLRGCFFSLRERFETIKQDFFSFFHVKCDQLQQNYNQVIKSKAKVTTSHAEILCNINQSLIQCAESIRSNEGKSEKMVKGFDETIACFDGSFFELKYMRDNQRMIVDLDENVNSLETSCYKIDKDLDSIEKQLNDFSL